MREEWSTSEQGWDGKGERGWVQVEQGAGESGTVGVGKKAVWLVERYWEGVRRESGKGSWKV